MKAMVKKWGNSLALRLPSSLIKSINIYEGVEVNMTIEGDKIIIKPYENGYTLDELLKGISDENLHGEIDDGGSIGVEQW